MEENNISIEDIENEIKKLKLEIIEKQNKIIELSSIINGTDKEEVEN